MMDFVINPSDKAFECRVGERFVDFEIYSDGRIEIYIDMGTSSYEAPNAGSASIIIPSENAKEFFENLGILWEVWKTKERT